MPVGHGVEVIRGGWFVCPAGETVTWKVSVAVAALSLAVTVIVCVPI
jgi:hypothetical protein